MNFFIKINSTFGPLECHFWLHMTKVVLTVMSWAMFMHVWWRILNGHLMIKIGR